MNGRSRMEARPRAHHAALAACAITMFAWASAQTPFQARPPKDSPTARGAPPPPPPAPPEPVEIVPVVERVTEDDERPRGPAPWAEPYFPFLADESPEGSVSVGDTSHGYIVNARCVTEGESLGILPRQRARDLRYGSDQLIDLLEQTGAKFTARTKTRFWIGNIGRRGGGDILYSVSHNSGRDADIALAYTDLAGKPTDPPDLVPVDGSGASRERDKAVRFDVARTWQVVKALLDSDKGYLQFLFLARPLTEKLKQHATLAKEPAELIDRAMQLLKQPAGAPHDDHLHVRVYCSPRDIEGGCENAGPIHGWAKPERGARLRRIQKAEKALAHEDAEQRARAIERLVLLGAADKAPSLFVKVEDPSPRVRGAAAAAMAHFGGEPESQRLVQLLATERDPVAKGAFLGALSELGGPTAAVYFTEIVRDAAETPWREATLGMGPSLPLSPVSWALRAAESVSLVLPGFSWTKPDPAERAIQLYAIEAVGFMDSPLPVEPLFALVIDGDLDMRARAALSLSRLTNTPVPGTLTDSYAARADRLRAAEPLFRDIEPLARTTRDGWILDGFSRVGLNIQRVSSESAWDVLRALRKGEPYSHNASRVLERIAAQLRQDPESPARLRRTPALADTRAECRYWLRLLESKRQELKLPKPDDDIAGACR